MPDEQSPQPNIEPNVQAIDVSGALPPEAVPQQPLAIKNSGRFGLGHKRTRWLILATVVVAAVAVTAGIFLRKSTPPQTAKLTNISVRLAWVNNPEFAGMYVAQVKGYYQAAGLKVNLKEFQDSTDVNKEVSTGTVDYGVSTPLEVILARDKGQTTKAIAAIYQTSAFSFVSKTSANIHTPSDFKGKVLGKSGDNNEAAVTYAALLAYDGLKTSDVTIKGIGFDVLADFNQNQADVVDLFRNDQTYLLDQAHISYNQIFPEDYGFAIYGDVLIASDSTIAHKPAQTRAFVQATLKGWQYAIAHQTETLAILAKYDNVLYKDPAYVKYDFTGTIPLIKPTDGTVLGSMEYVPWNRAYEAVNEAGLLTNPGQQATDAYTTAFLN